MDSPMNVAVFMSGSGTNAVNLLKYQQRLEDKGEYLFKISIIVTDNKEEGNNAWNIAKSFGLGEPIYLDFKEFRRAHITNPKDFSQREPYFRKIDGELAVLKPKIDCLAFAGWEVITTRPLISTFSNTIINVHPADLSIRDENGRAVFVGNHVVRDAILKGEKEIRSSTHLVNDGVDQGAVLLISKPIKVNLPPDVTLKYLELKENEQRLQEIADEHQSQLKRVGDWEIFGPTVHLFSKGVFSLDENQVIHLYWRAIPNGCIVETIPEILKELNRL